MNLAPFTGPGSTPARRRFWDQARAIVLASQKLAGRNVTVSEHIGKGTIINARRDRGTAPVGDCHPSNLCTLDLSFTSDVYNVSQTGLSITPNVCDTDGWNGIWKTDCASDDCGHATKYCTTEASCVCGVRLEWNEIVGTAIDFSYVRIILDKIVGDGTLADGWYMWVTAHMENGTDDCYWESAACPSFPCTCVYLGADDSIFDTDLLVSVPMIEDVSFPCSGDGSLDLTFHPC